MCTQNKPILICGDFNYPEIEWDNEYVNDSSNTISAFIDAVQDNHLYQHIFKPTRYRNGNEPSLLDLIFTTEEGMMRELHHNPGLGDSDHELIDFIIDTYQPAEDSLVKENFFKADYVTIRDRLKQIDWENELVGNFVTAYPKFIDILKKIDGWMRCKMYTFS